MGLHILFKEAWPVHRLPYFGIAFFGGGFWLMAHAAGLFRKNETPHDSDREALKLVTEGAFRYTRNPMYLGMTLMLAGIACMDGTAPFYATPVLFLLIVDLTHVRREEKSLEKKFGAAYLEYEKKVRRWL
jgi:protein-S-isoprenylcysteine O-methyltransferase Ste14